MKLVVQRVLNADVSVDNKTVGKINKGFLVLLGITHSDTKEDADYLVRKLINLRVFTDENDKMNLSLQSVNGELLIVSQFTLYADCKKGFRPGFTRAGDPAHAEALYEYIIKACRMGRPEMQIETGSFGADMKVSLINDGPFTIILDSSEI